MYLNAGPNHALNCLFWEAFDIVTRVFRCVRNIFRCDGVDDCEDAEDEMDCSEYCTEFKCSPIRVYGCEIPSLPEVLWSSLSVFF